MKIYLDPGHGGSDPGASGYGLKEKDVVLDIALRIRTKLINSGEKIEVRMSRTSDITKSLKQRTDEANKWGANYFVSIHCNAFNGKARGYEDYIFTSAGNMTEQYRKIMHQEISKVNFLQNRGTKRANFHVLRETIMPAFLSENGFIDNMQDVELMKSAHWREKIALGHTNGILRAFGLIKKSNPPIRKEKLYTVIAGSFISKDGAIRRVKRLESQRITAFIKSTTLSRQNWYRVQAGAFHNRLHAERLKERIEKLGIKATILSS